MGDAADAFAVFSFTVPGIPLIYSGQEAGLNKQLAFFEKDEIDWSDLEKQNFYKKLVNLKKENPALWNGEVGGDFKLLDTSENEKVLAYTREKNTTKLLVILNLSAGPVVCGIEFGVQEEFEGCWEEQARLVGGKGNIELQTWEFRVYKKI
jgi:1,4-alpha-glucan branching enzyme